MTQQEVVTEKIKEFVEELNGRFKDQISDQTLEKYLYHSFWNEYVLRDEIQRGDNHKIRASELAQYSNAILLFTAICEEEDTQLSIKNTDSLLFQFQSKFKGIFLIGNLKNQYNPMTFKIGKVGQLGGFSTIYEKSTIPEPQFWEQLQEKIKEQLGEENLNQFDEAYDLVKRHVEGNNEISVLDKWFKIEN